MDPSHLALIGTYCTVQGLQSVAAKRFNGCECFISKVDPENPTERFAVLFTMDRGSGDAKYVSLKPANLVPKTSLIVKDSTLLSSSEIAGKGVFATRDIKRGEILVLEKPFLVVPSNANAATIKETVNKTLSEPEREIFLTFSAIGVPESARVEAACYGDEEAAEMWLIANANRITDLKGTSAVYALISRINHCCMLGKNGKNGSLNAWWFTQSNADNARALTAARDITAGEEIFVEYAENSVDPEDRRAALAKYGIVGCACPLCHSDDASNDESFSNAAKTFVQKLDALKSYSVHINRRGDGPHAGKQHNVVAAEVEKAHSELREAGKAFVDAAAAVADGERQSIQHFAALIANRTAIAHCDAVACVLTFSIQQGGRPAEITKHLENYKVSLAERRRVKLEEWCAGNEAHPFAVYGKDCDTNDLAVFTQAIEGMKKNGQWY